MPKTAKRASLRAGAAAEEHPGAKTIGLCMIVKDETKVIRRCLESALPLVDYVLVVDTGSTDGTQQMIRDFLAEHHVKGAVIEEPWRDFAWNRTFALERLREVADIDYALVIDADDTIEVEPGFDPKAFKSGMTHDFYDVQIRYADIAYARPQICSNRMAFTYKGVLHEYLEGPPGQLSRATAAGFAMRASTGGARSGNPSKYRDDALVLERALTTETDPFLISRYTFYLAQSYKDCGEREKAVENYLKRAELGYWAEEVYVGLLEAGKLMAALARPYDEVIATFERATTTVPARAEALHAASRYCRNNRKYVEGQEFARRGLALTLPAAGLFIQPWIYEYGLLDEFSVNAYWAGAYRESLDASLRLLSSDKLPATMVKRIEANARFASKNLPREKASAPNKADRITLLVHPRPERFLNHVVDMFSAGLSSLGIDAVIANGFQPGVSGRAIIFGAHRFTESQLLPLARNSVIFNVENVASKFMTDGYRRLLKNFHVWDYSAANAIELSAIIGRPVHYAKLFYVDRLSRIASVAEKDIDVLFFGSFNPRRTAVLNQLRARGLRVEAVFNVFGAELDALIARANVVINIHFYDNGHLEIIRLFDLLANGCAVVSELNPGEAVDADLANALLLVPYDRLVDATEALVRDPSRRDQLAATGRRTFARRRPEEILPELLAASEPSVLPSAALVGSGKAYDATALNIDINGNWHPDIVADIADPKLFERDHASTRFGKVRLPRSWFDTIRASHVIEHLPDLVAAMTNMLNLLADGGTLHVAVPYDLSYGAWQDPTHVRAFNERSWLYYCEWHWYLGWDEACFDRIAMDFGFSDLGRALAAKGVPQDEILRTPRAVDEMRVTLRKRLLSEQEQGQGRAMRGDARGTARDRVADAPNFARDRLGTPKIAAQILSSGRARPHRQDTREHNRTAPTQERNGLAGRSVPQVLAASTCASPAVARIKLLLICGPWGSGTSVVAAMAKCLGAQGFGPYYKTNDPRTPVSYEFLAFRDLILEYASEETVALRTGAAEAALPALRNLHLRIEQQEFGPYDVSGKAPVFFKLPISALLIPQICAVFDAKLVYVMRPLDQIERSRIRRNWPKEFGAAGAKIIYSIMANCRESHPIVTIDYAQLLATPARHARDLAGFAGLHPGVDAIESAAGVVRSE